MKFLSILILWLVIISCSNKKKYNNTSNVNIPTENEVKEIPEKPSTVPFEEQSIPSAEDSIPVIKIADRVINGFALEFTEVSKAQYDSLKSRVISKNIPLSAHEDLVVQYDSCFILTLRNSDPDTICDFNDGEYYEYYNIKGLWSDVNHLLVNFQNWEEQHDFLINTNNGNHYILGPDYKLSPNKKLMLSYINLIDYPIYPNDFILSEFTPERVTEYFNIDFGELSINSADWISDNEILLFTGQIDEETWRLTHPNYYILKILKGPN